jgi:hypothetical protein
MQVRQCKGTDYKEGACYLFPSPPTFLFFIKTLTLESSAVNFPRITVATISITFFKVL